MLGYHLLDFAFNSGVVGAYASLEGYECLAFHQSELQYSRSLSPRRLREYQAGRSLARQLLAVKVADSNPMDWRLATSDGRKPTVLFRGSQVPNIDVSITHTRNVVAVVVGDGTQVGIDAEPVDRVIKQSIWPRFLAPAELVLLKAFDPKEIPQRVQELWCMKEAISKASGLGLAASFSEIVFSFRQKKWNLEKLPDQSTFVGSWETPCLQHKGGHLFAVCVHAI